MDLKKFNYYYDLWKGTYKSALISYVGLNTEQGMRLLYGRIVLSPDRHVIDNFRLETKHIAAAVFIVDLNDSAVDSLFSKAQKGEILCEMSGKTLALEKDSNISTYFVAPRLSEGLIYPSLRYSGTSTHNLLLKIENIYQLDLELKGARQPFDNLNELLTHCGLSGFNQMRDSTTLEIIARAPVSMSDKSKIKGTKAIIQCQASKKLDLRKVRLGYRVIKDNDVKRGSQESASIAWKEENEQMIGVVELSVEENSILQAFLSYEDVCIQQWWVIDPDKRLNQRQSIHEVIDKNSEILLGMTDIDKADQFEGIVSILLYILGFSVVHYGKMPKFREACDIIALTPSGNVLVVECTTGLIDENNKLDKLAQRTNVIKAKMRDTGYSHAEVQTVIVTRVSKEEVKTSLDKASKHNIAVICKEDIEGLLNRIRLIPNAEELFKEAKNFVPSIAQVAPVPAIIAPLVKP